MQGENKHDIFLYEFYINWTVGQIENANLSKHIQLNRNYVEYKPINN